ncbi:MAG: DUF6596 domain-containing protein [Myxococcota bacterium]
MRPLSWTSRARRSCWTRPTQARIQGAADALFGAFSLAHDRGPPHERARLGRLVIDQTRRLVDGAKAERLQSLLALLLLTHARVEARFDGRNEPIPLEHQDRRRWKRADLDEGFERLARVEVHDHFAIKAALAAEHGRASTYEGTNWSAIAALYERLIVVDGSPATRLGWIVADSRGRGPEAGLAALDRSADMLDALAGFHAARGAMLRELGRVPDARQAYERAEGLAFAAP